MTALAPHIAPRIARLVGLLSSDLDGEVIGAARAIGRTLDGAELDWHDLAAIIENSSGSPAPRDQRQRRDAPPPPDMVRALLASAALSRWERQFVNGIARALYRAEALTPAQIAKLREIHFQRIEGGA